MRIRPYILRFIAFFLLLVFLQKSGAGLFLHSLFHDSTSQSLTQNENRELSYACTCVDDFFLPFEPVDEIVVSAPSVNYAPQYADALVTVAFRAVAYSSLRGPPAML